jgi:hypothetical protein
MEQETKEQSASQNDIAVVTPCTSPKPHLVPRCIAWISCNLARRRYIPFPKLLKLKTNEFWRRTRSSALRCASWVISSGCWKHSRTIRQKDARAWKPNLPRCF